MSNRTVWIATLAFLFLGAMSANGEDLVLAERG